MQYCIHGQEYGGPEMRLSRSAILGAGNYRSLSDGSESWDSSILREHLKKAVVQIALETQRNIDDGSIRLIQQVWSQVVNREETSAMRSMLTHLPVAEEIVVR